MSDTEVSDTGSQATQQTSRGRLTVTWATNGWAMAEVGGRSDQRQVRSWGDLADLLRRIGLSAGEADREARSLWAQRPKDAGEESARPSQSLMRATGLPAWAIGLILLGVIGLYVLVRLAGLHH